jgi:hypothetical protein
MNHQIEKPFSNSLPFKLLVWFSLITFLCIQLEQFKKQQQTHDTERTTETNHR